MREDVEVVCVENRRLIGEAKAVVIETYKLIASIDLLKDFGKLIAETFGDTFIVGNLDHSLTLSGVFTPSFSDLGVEQVLKEALDYASNIMG